MIARQITRFFDGKVELTTAHCADAHALAAEEWLTPEEHQRYFRYRQAIDADRFLIGRYLALQVLGEAVGLAPENVEVLLGETGKPYVAAGPDFSISHGGEIVALAMAHSGHIGVDVEPIGRIEALDPLIQRVCNASEANWVNEVGGAAGFGRLWCLKEAVLKATGQGLTVDPREVAIDPASGLLLAIEGKKAVGWHLTTHGGAPDVICALAWHDR